MLYIIDGYNLIGKSSQIRLESDAKEAELIELLGTCMEGKRDRIKLVFDGHGPMNMMRGNERYGAIQVIFTHEGESADDYIKSFIRQRKNPTGVIVVTSDKEILKESQKYNMKWMPSEVFLSYYHPIKRDEVSDDSVSEHDVERWLAIFDQNGTHTLKAAQSKRMKSIGKDLSDQEVDDWLELFNAS